MNSVSTALLATPVQFLPGQKELLWKEQRREATNELHMAKREYRA